MLETFYLKTRVKAASLIGIKDFEQNIFFRAEQFSSGYPIIHGSRFYPKVNKLASGSRFLVGWIDHNHKLIIFTSPKVGTTSLKHVVATINEQISGTPIISSFEWIQKQGKLNWRDFKGYKKIMPIRDPFDRYLSFFENKIVSPYQKQIVSGIDSIMVKFLLNLAYLKDNKHQSSLGELSFRSTIDQLYKICFNQSRILWDVHLIKQLTADFKYIAMNQVQFFDSIYLSDFIRNWLSMYNLSAYNIHLNRGNPESSFVANASDLPLAELCGLSTKPSRDSFFQDELSNKLYSIYQDDYQIYNRFKGTKPILF
ncbi:MAG: sulfotransferase family protein [Schleiferiaceae bacterium]|nr:sulfotransferase family protein [Schleiferiaceae bacterium]